MAVTVTVYSAPVSSALIIQCFLSLQLPRHSVDDERSRHPRRHPPVEYVSTSPGSSATTGAPRLRARRRVLSHFPCPARDLTVGVLYQDSGRGTSGRCWSAGALRTVLYEFCRVVLSSPSPSSYMAVARSTLPTSPASGSVPANEPACAIGRG